MRKNYLPFIYCAITIIFLSASCKKNETGPEADTTKVTLNFKANYDGETFVTNKVFEYDETPIQFHRFEFYAAEIALLKENASAFSELELKDIDFINLSFDQTELAEAEQGIALPERSVERGAYSGLTLGVGVPREMNETTWTDYASGHPLRNDGFYWSGWDSFIFSKIEGSLDTDGDGTFESSFVYHAGRDSAYFKNQIFRSLDFDSADPQEISINIDVKKLFEASNSNGCDMDGNGLLDLGTDDCSRSHSTGPSFPIVIDMMANYEGAMQLE